MARLPIPGSDNGQWGTLLNEYLEVAHQSSGALKAGVVSTSNVQDASITKSKLDAAVQASLDNADAALDDAGVASLVTDTGTDTGSALAGEFAQLVHTHTISQVTNLQVGLDAKAAASFSSAVLIESGGVYPSRPAGYANARFIGATDPGGAAVDGDEWIQLT